MSTAPLMPKATAIWLLDNPTLTFEQIGDYCHLHALEIKAIADGEIAAGMAPFDPDRPWPVEHGRDRALARHRVARLVAQELKAELVQKRRGGGRYVPVSEARR